jgi:hypothetical protein
MSEADKRQRRGGIKSTCGGVIRGEHDNSAPPEFCFGWWCRRVNKLPAAGSINDDSKYAA